MKMNKIYGATTRQDGVSHIGRKKWELFYGFGKDEGQENGWNWRQMFDHAPTKEEIKDSIYDTIDTEAQEKILSGLTYGGLLVWLSAENQRNYAATAIRLQGGDTSALPVTVKLGTDEAPVLQLFSTVDDFLAFFNAVNKHISDTLAEAWQAKLSIDWDKYELKE